jgi:PAS domain-containing protein
LSAVFDPAGQPWANPENVAAAAAALAGPQSWAAPSALGLPVYSQSGFDLLSVLGRVVNRTSPKIQLGPVDMTCAFVVSDTRRYDSPIVYASPTFCALTGYAEHEILGRNCRFLQAPDGRVQKGEERRYTAPDAVSHMRKCLSADKECQTSLVNYKKGGQAFINLVTMIPVFGGVNDSAEERDTVVYHVGFQVDLTQQPNAILQRLKDGSYIVNYSSSSPIAPAAGPGGRRTQASAPLVPMSNDLRRLLADDSFIRSLPLSTSVNAVHNAERADAYDDHQLLHMLLLEALPDFVHVLSLKGVFLYAAPSVRRVLGYEPSELVGRSIADFCHPADLVPLMRELKESSTAQSLAEAGAGVNSNVQTGVQSVQAILAGSGGGPPKTVDLLFRCKSKGGEYVWLDCRGRLHVEGDYHVGEAEGAAAACVGTDRAGGRLGVACAW